MKQIMRLDLQVGEILYCYYECTKTNYPYHFYKLVSDKDGNPKVKETIARCADMDAFLTALEYYLRNGDIEGI